MAEQKEAEVTDLAPASETPSTNQPGTEAPAASTGADTPEKPQSRSEFIRQQIEGKDAGDAKVQRRAPEGQFKRGPGRPSKAEIAAREAAKAKVEKPAETPATSVAKPAVEAKPVETPAAATQTAFVPTGLRAPFKATFGQLSKEWQEEIARLDKTAQEAAEKVGSKYAPDAKFAQEIRAEIQPYEMMIRAEGGTPQTAVKALLQDAYLFRFGSPQQKQQRLAQIAQTYNVPLPSAAAQSEVQADAGLPDITQHPAYQNLMGTVQQLQQNFTQQTQAQSQAQEASNLEAVNAFLSETDAKGNAKHPLDESHHGAWAEEIGLIRRSNPSWDARRVLDKAYENLSWKVPELRTVILQRQEADKKAKEAADLAAKRAAAVSVRGSPASPASSNKPQNRREFLAEQIAGLNR